MDASVGIATRNDHDLVACVAALRKSHETDRYPMNWPDDPVVWLSPPDTIRAWIAVTEDHVVGHIVLAGHGATGAEITRLFVTPRAQRSGVGAALLAAAREYAVHLGRRLELNVVEDSAAAVRLYEGLGWTLLGRAPAPFTRTDGTRPVERRYAAPSGDRRPGSRDADRHRERTSCVPWRVVRSHPGPPSTCGE